MTLEPDKVYKVTKGNTDRSILTGDLIFIDSKSGALVVPAAKGCLRKTSRHNPSWTLNVFVFEEEEI